MCLQCKDFSHITNWWRGYFPHVTKVFSNVSPKVEVSKIGTLPIQKQEINVICDMSFLTRHLWVTCHNEMLPKSDVPKWYVTPLVSCYFGTLPFDNVSMWHTIWWHVTLARHSLVTFHCNTTPKGWLFGNVSFSSCAFKPKLRSKALSFTCWHTNWVLSCDNKNPIQHYM
jgi:hypothetical protein